LAARTTFVKRLTLLTLASIPNRQRCMGTGMFKRHIKEFKRDEP
jgi:hypothetical protein